jgi:alpha-tubulin suppressor-like RCC1 family protein
MKVLFAFGLNEDGQCGCIEKNVIRPTPIYFPLKPLIVAISAGSRHTMALSDHGFVYSWGWGHLGQLGHGENCNVFSPRKIDTLDNITLISSGGMHSGCVDNKLRCYMWGDNSHGQLGLGSSSVFETVMKGVSTPTLMVIGGGGESSDPNDNNNDNTQLVPVLITKLSCGGMHSSFLDDMGAVFCCGKADSGQTGYDKWYYNFLPSLSCPMKVKGITEPAVDVVSGAFYTLILTKSGKVFAMGKEDFGVLGIGKAKRGMNGADTPTLVSALKDHRVTAISAGGWHSCFLTDTGSLYTCGKGEYGRLGNGDEKSRCLPTAVLHPKDEKGIEGNSVSAVSAGGSHTIWTTRNGDIYTTGRLDNGRCGISEEENISQGGSVSDRISVAANIKQYFPMHSTIEILQIAAGGSHSVVLVECPDGCSFF